MGYRKLFLIGFILFVGLASFVFAEDYSLNYFLSKTKSQTTGLSKKEKTELFNQLDGIMKQAKTIHTRLMQTIQIEETDIRYQEGKFWMARLEEDQKWIEAGTQQIGLLREKPDHLVASISLYRSLKELSSSFNAYNNRSAFSAWVGDLAPEMELWTDPVFYQLYLLPLARSKEAEMRPIQKEKKPVEKEKKR